MGEYTPTSQLDPFGINNSELELVGIVGAGKGGNPSVEQGAFAGSGDAADKYVEQVQQADPAFTFAAFTQRDKIFTIGDGV